ncbi:hypothetical protein HHX47_DHR10000408 [Lentinula edodes]|nr:hypothetical protein HHX47_DHR10000408 [Lentinula edodes]
MLTIWKPWRQLTDITSAHVSANAAWYTFENATSGKYNSFLENVQYFYRCSDHSSARRAKEYSTYEALPDTGEASHGDDDDSSQTPQQISMDDIEWTDEEILKLQDNESARDQEFGLSAMECAYEAGIFQQEYVVQGPVNLCSSAKPADKAAFKMWATLLKQQTHQTTSSMEIDGGSANPNAVVDYTHSQGGIEARNHGQLS